MDLPQAERLRKRRLDGARSVRLAGRARALGDPTRLMVAAALGHAAELCVCDLSWVAERPTNLVSHHLKVLRKEGLVQSRRDGKLVLYRLTEDGRSLLAALFTERARTTAG